MQPVHPPKASSEHVALGKHSAGRIPGRGDVGVGVHPQRLVTCRSTACHTSCCCLRVVLIVLIDDAIVLEERGEALLEKGNGGVGLGVRAHPTAEGGLIGSRGDGGDEKEAGEHCCRWGVLEKSGCAKRRPEKSSRACGRSMGDVR